MNSRKTVRNLIFFTCSFLFFLVLIIFSCEKLELVKVTKVTTGSITETKQTSCTALGSVIEISEEGITQHGHCWSTSTNPTTGNSKTQLGSRNTTGDFTSTLTGLIPNTTYHIKAYAIDGNGTAYSNEIIFTTLQVATPSVITSSVSSITTNSAICKGNVTDEGGEAVTAKGVCWSTNQNPTVADNHTNDGSGTGSFTSDLIGLSSNTTYYAKAYATNKAGTAYGDQYIIKTATGTITDVEGNNYYTVTIGTQVWMKENLKTNKYNDGTSISQVMDNTEWSNLTNPGYCYYNNDGGTYKATYGALYNWYTVNTGKLCPAGWHVPTDAEWTLLKDYLGGENVAGGKVKETDTIHWNKPNAGATNESGFTALPGGYRIKSGYFYDIGNYTLYWSVTEISSYDAWGQNLGYNNPGMLHSDYFKEGGLSVRCIEGEAPVLPVAITNEATGIIDTSATLNGIVNASGQSTTVIFEYGTSVSYGSTITADQSPVTGSTDENVSAGISGLTANTTYYFRVKAVNIAGTTYGSENVFQTTIGPPKLTTIAVTSITITTASSGGDITSDGGASVTTRGVCWSTNQNPTVADNHTDDGSGTGSFTSSITGLLSNTTYYARAYATNSVGTAYGEQYIIKTATDTVTDIEGNSYFTVTIGTQVWMKENLKTTKYNDGESIPQITENTQWGNMTTPAYCWSNNDVSNKDTYGALYNAYAVNTGKLCPPGWHVPTDSEWTVLTDYLGGESVAGGKMKEAGTIHWVSYNTGATNESGFTALGATGRGRSGAFGVIGNSEGWWSSTGGLWLQYRIVTRGSVSVQKNNGLQEGQSLRCLKD